MYVINAHILRKNGAYLETVQVPTFYLEENVQGVTSEKEARKIAEKIINPFGMDMTIAVVAVKVS